MNVGMLWFNNDPKVDFSEKIKGAAEYYHAKYGVKPTACHVNPANIPDNYKTNGVEVIPNKSMLLNHFWLGVKDEQKA